MKRTLAALALAAALPAHADMCAQYQHVQFAFMPWALSPHPVYNPLRTETLSPGLPDATHVLVIAIDVPADQLPRYRGRVEIWPAPGATHGAVYATLSEWACDFRQVNPAGPSDNPKRSTADASLGPAMLFNAGGNGSHTLLPGRRYFVNVKYTYTMPLCAQNQNCNLHVMFTWPASLVP